MDVIVINGKKFATFLFLYMFGGMALNVFLLLTFHVFFVFVIGAVIFFLGPLLLRERFRRPFSKKAKITFDENRFFVEIFEKDITEASITHDNKVENIESFRAIDSAKDDSSYLKLYFKNGNSVTYNFLGQGEANKVDVIERFFEFVNAYNDLHQEAKIKIRPNFFAQKAGLYCIIGLSILVIIAIVIQVSLNPKTIPFSLMSGIALFVIILAQRQKDVQQSKRLK